MKRIIAAALSILVGAFGYNIVDKALEDRVATLESEVVELREEVSGYHSYENTLSSVNSTTTTKGYISPTKLKIGDYLVESPQSRHIFRLRMYSNGNVTCHLPNNENHYTLPNFGTVVYQNSISLVNENSVGTSKNDTKSSHTTNLDYEEFYLYITETSAQITDIETNVSYIIREDENYSKISFPIEDNKTTILISCKGYTDPVLAGRKIRFYYSTEAFSNQYITNTVGVDGSFEYVAKYSIRYVPYSNNAYGFGSVYVD